MKIFKLSINAINILKILIETLKLETPVKAYATLIIATIIKKNILTF